MGSLSIWHWLIVLVVVLLVFGGRGKIPDMMGDFAKGIKSFKKGLADDTPAPRLHDPVGPAPGTTIVPPPVTPGEPLPPAYDTHPR
jgi:sec-independent protein translocase protein TatA